MFSFFPVRVSLLQELRLRSIFHLSSKSAGLEAGTGSRMRVTRTVTLHTCHAKTTQSPHADIIRSIFNVFQYIAQAFSFIYAEDDLFSCSQRYSVFCELLFPSLHFFFFSSSIVIFLDLRNGPFSPRRRGGERKGLRGKAIIDLSHPLRRYKCFGGRRKRKKKAAGDHSPLFIPGDLTSKDRKRE